MSVIRNLIMKRKLAWSFEIIALGILAVLPLMMGNQLYTMDLLTLLMIYTILLIGLDITVGYLGQINLGQTAFLALGAYASALAAETWHLDLILCVAISFSFCFTLGALLAIPALRLYGPQFALATLSFTTLAAIVLNEWESLTMGAQGLSIVRPTLFGLTLNASSFFWICLLFVVLLWLGMHNFLNSQWGRAFRALRDSPIATDAVGIGVMRHKIIAFAIGSGLGGLAGGLYGFNLLYLQPLSFSFELMALLLLGVVLGGRKSLWGAFLGSSIVILLPNLLSNHIVFQSLAAIGFTLALIGVLLGFRQGKQLNFTNLAPLCALTLLLVGSFLIQSPEDWRKGIFAVILFSAVVGLPEGLMGYIEKQLQRLLKLPPNALPEPSQLDDVIPPIVSSSQILLEVENLRCYFGGVKAIDGVSFKVNSGKILGIIGPNGSGKSTLINVISGFYRPTTGRMIFESQDLPQGSLLKVSRRFIARTFQNLQLFHEMTALENVMSALRDAYNKPWFIVMTGLTQIEENAAQAKALALLSFVGLKEYAYTKAKNLPYGRQRFLEIARALATQPRLLILDEPAAGMPKSDATDLQNIIVKIRQRGVTVILIEHRMDIISQLCDEVIVLESGHIIAQGSAEQVKQNPKVIQAYLGKQDARFQPKKSKDQQKEVQHALLVKDVIAGYGLGDVLLDFNIQVIKGDIVVIIGANGVGKTTAMRVISGQLKTTSGNIKLWGQDITNLPAYQVVRRGLSHTPEGRGVFGELTVEDNLLLGAYIHLPKFFGFFKKAKDNLNAIYKIFPVLDRYRYKAAEKLSGGEQQMLAIGRSLMSKPQILLLDEPSMGLGPVVVESVFKTIKELNEQGISIFLVEQFAVMALSIADYSYVLEQGHVVVEGSPEELSRDPKVLKAYLGE
ncbi:MAG: ATP-binding cassette domain-containing protein [Candidatus Berkiellales bacterium]